MADQDDLSLDPAGDSLPFAENAVEEENLLQYGSLVLRVASKEGKANTLLADQFFSPSLLLAEHIERGILSFEGLSVIEIGAGSALPSLLSATLSKPPSLVLVTDHPDEGIITNLRRNVSANEERYGSSCVVRCLPYIWGESAEPLLGVLSERGGAAGYDVMILSDLLYFDNSHLELVKSITLLLSRSPGARAYVAAGTYTPPTVCDAFFALAKTAGLECEERTDISSSDEMYWRGKLPVVGLTKVELSARKKQVRWWILKWSELR